MVWTFSLPRISFRRAIPILLIGLCPMWPVAVFAQPAPICDESIERLAGELAEYRGRLVVLGETHGTREVPALVGELACHLSRHGTVLVGLELPYWLNETIAAFVDGRIGEEALLVDDYWRTPIQDGRQSRAMLNLLRRLGEVAGIGRGIVVKGFDDAIVVFEGEREPKHTRDELMTRHVVRYRSETAHDFALVVVGNSHAQRSSLPEPTLGNLLPKDETLTINVQSLRGNAGNCRGRKCGTHAFPNQDVAEPVLRLNRVSYGPYDARIVLREGTASLPAVSEETGAQ